MKFYTSYYANFKNIPTNFVCVGISRSCPDGFEDGGYPNFLFVKDNILAPDSALLEDFKAGRETEDGYKRRYIEHFLDQFGYYKKFKSFEDFVAALEKEYGDKYEAMVFLCYEKPSDFCHRHILRDMMNKVFNIPCEELGSAAKKDEKLKNVELF